MVRVVERPHFQHGFPRRFHRSHGAFASRAQRPDPRHVSVSGPRDTSGASTLRVIRGIALKICVEIAAFPPRGREPEGFILDFVRVRNRKAHNGPGFARHAWSGVHSWTTENKMMTPQRHKDTKGVSPETMDFVSLCLCGVIYLVFPPARHGAAGGHGQRIFARARYSLLREEDASSRAQRRAPEVTPCAPPAADAAFPPAPSRPACRAAPRSCLAANEAASAPAGWPAPSAPPSAPPC